ncbi:hypothetical protein [Glacieibacterium frigidum]|uniref:Uncharacterized protein n=1 Tax=Glacieibacterium frigidum TaxID=2593303 RepID=A0A552U837_9SPHN|nr:hypothetical protein [Glacieibacterium frigidum]TRW14383.1 hypothetical protein FMM06_11770 [Glacieibacterium frigidum]
MSFLAPSPAEVRRRRILVGGGSVFATVAIAAAFFAGRPANYMRPDPVIIFVDSWSAKRDREDALETRASDKAQLEAKLAESRAYIATLPPEKRKLAQAEYDRYVAASPKDRIS